jgi:hypothetical protein
MHEARAVVVAVLSWMRDVSLLGCFWMGYSCGLIRGLTPLAVRTLAQRYGASR